MVKSLEVGAGWMAAGSRIVAEKGSSGEMIWADDKVTAASSVR